jgi:hypothetical protein
MSIFKKSGTNDKIQHKNLNDAIRPAVTGNRQHWRA